MTRDADHELHDADDLGARVAKLEHGMRLWRAVAVAALTFAIGGLGAAAKGIYGRGYDEGRYEIRLDNVEASTHRLEERLLWRASPSLGDHP